jgi:hypothetical protein
MFAVYEQNHADTICKGKRVTRPDAKTPWLLAFD